MPRLQPPPDVIQAPACPSWAILAQVVEAIGQASRQQLVASTRVCDVCGGRYGGGGCCPLCAGTGLVCWDKGRRPGPQLVAWAAGRAGRGEPSVDGYLWLACHFPALVHDPAIQAMLRAEVEAYPVRALLGYAPDTLRAAGLGDLVAAAARQNPAAARASLKGDGCHHDSHP